MVLRGVCGHENEKKPIHTYYSYEFYFEFSQNLNVENFVWPDPYFDDLKRAIRESAGADQVQSRRNRSQIHVRVFQDMFNY